jgi:uncharacterized protein
VSRHRWLLPETPDIVGLLRAQASVTHEGLELVVAWAEGDTAAAATLADVEQRGDAAKRALLEALRAAFVTPMEPEDVFALSSGIDWILNHARDLVRESQALRCPPDEVIAEMTRVMRDAVDHIDQALARIGETVIDVASGSCMRCSRRPDLQRPGRRGRPSDDAPPGCRG